MKTIISTITLLFLAPSIEGKLGASFRQLQKQCAVADENGYPIYNFENNYSKRLLYVSSDESRVGGFLNGNKEFESNQWILHAQDKCPSTYKGPAKTCYALYNRATMERLAIEENTKGWQGGIYMVANSNLGDVNIPANEIFALEERIEECKGVEPCNLVTIKNAGTNGRRLFAQNTGDKLKNFGAGDGGHVYGDQKWKAKPLWRDI
ncbi:expressed unknown protein [Seminavis robusta]|uniref:DUF4189 domain-containing protein n=1 Tax=Seminavis robusta TaxID=568900 RepID=A0A9N8EMA2_9STRA|nr:expressed unknown protein [Seminavis robusta]|eukprot:Sro1356_g265690.1 n/a (207) ;mRNA; f:11721-12341